MNTNATFIDKDGESLTLSIGEDINLQDAYNVVANKGLKATEIQINNNEISTAIPENQEEMKEEIIFGSIKTPTNLSILKKYNLTQDELVDILKVGTEHEFEHTTSVRMAMAIAKAHIYEDKDYYTKLKKAKLKQGAILETARYFKNGGSIDNPSLDMAGYYKRGGKMPKVHIVNEGKQYNNRMYEGIVGDYDNDGISNADDPNPMRKGDKESIEQLKFEKTFNYVVDTKNTLDNDLNEFVDKLKEKAPSSSAIYGRTKTPFSIINKLVSSRMLDQKRGLKDLIGTTIAVNNLKDLTKMADLTLVGQFGKVLEFEDFYSSPKDGYRAYHFIVEHNGVPVELQIKTTRMKEIGLLSHDAYKNKTLNAEYMNFLTELANRADKGEKDAIQEFDLIMQDKEGVERKLNKLSEGTFAKGGRLNIEDKYNNINFDF
jgi:ppGpp synthetase/RelA/SpoT-type nucleotidyltranferase